MPDATDNRVLSQLMLLQSTLDSMPTDESMSRFVVRGLKSVPGVKSLNVCIRGAVAGKNDLCASCNSHWGEIEDNFDYPCKLEDHGHTRCLPIRTVDRLYGFVVFSLNDAPDAFTPYEPYLQNIVNVIALSIDNRQQKQVLDVFNKQLQEEVEHRKQTEEALRESEELFRSHLEYAPDGVYMNDLEGIFLYGNRKCEEIIGYRREELIGKNFLELNILPQKSLNKAVQLLQANMEGKSTGPDEIDLISKEGRLIPVEINTNVVQRMGQSIVLSFVRDITIRKQAEEKIKASLLEKETMLKEIHHRVKNNLQVISSLLSLQSSYLQDEKAREMFQNSMDRVKIMANIHTMLYQSDDLARVDFGGFIRDLASRLQQSYGIAESPIQVRVDVVNVSLTIETSIPCGLILNELVSNTFKHAFPERRGGEIHISMTTAGDQFVLTVRDNGIGFPESVDFRNTQSLGLELVNLLVGQMNGKIDMQVDGGTTWTIKFPVKSEREWRNG
jgi:PAS domain S-box-containing protein